MPVNVDFYGVRDHSSQRNDLTVTDFGVRHPIALDLAGDDTNGKMPRPEAGRLTLVVYAQEGHRPRRPRPRGGEASRLSSTKAGARSLE